MEESQNSPEAESNKDKASIRRKRKLPNSPSSLVGSTIQEYAVFSKDGEELTSQVQRMFDFLEPWQRNADRMDKAIMNSALSNGSAKGSYSSESDDISLSSSSTIEREPSLEEELQLRLGRMTSIAKTLRFLCSKEREQRANLFTEVQECKNKCVRLVQDLAMQYKQKENVMQQRLSETERVTEKLEKEKTSLQQTCHDIATQAKKTIVSLEKELTSTNDSLNKRNQELNDISKSKDNLDEEHRVLKAKNIELSDEITDLKHKMKSAELQKRDSDMAREHYMTLLDMSLSKLRMFEEGIITARVKDRQFRSPTPDSGHISVSPDTAGARSLELSIPLLDGKKPFKSTGDSMSITSLETLSDVSVSLTDTSRLTNDDKTSTASSSYSRLIPISPVIPPRKNKKKKNFFSNPFIKKSASLDQPDEPADRLPTIKDIPIMERYTSSTVDLSEPSEEKIRDFSSTPCLFNSPPLPRTTSQPSLNLELSELQVIPPVVKRNLKKQRSKSHDRLSDHENFRNKANDKERSPDVNDRREGKQEKMFDRLKDKPREKSQERGRDKTRDKSRDKANDKSRDRGREKSRDRGRSKTRDQDGKKPERKGSNKVKDKSKEAKDCKDVLVLDENKNPDQSDDAKVQRNASFAAMKPKKNGLVALAKDIEKRFKKKRRSKTADFAELFKSPEMLQKAKLEAGTLRSADTNDVDSYC